MIDSSNIVNGSTGGSTAPQSTQARQQLDSNYADFLKLLTTQLKNQDPTAPTDTNQLTQQIATLSQVEQQINTNKNLEKLITMINATQYNSVISYIGKQIEANGNQGALENGKAPFAYYLARDAANVDITISDASGRAVYTASGPATAGRKEFVWDGKNNAGQQMPDGIYTLKVEAKDASQNAITAQPYTTGIVTSIDSVDGTVYLSLGNILSIPITQVVSVRQSGTQT